MCKIKDLEWHDVIGAEGTSWYAQTPMLYGYRGIYINYEEGKYWPAWNTSLPGYETLKQAQDQAQIDHDAWVSSFLEIE